MRGRLVLAGLDPDRTPLDDWCAATFAALIETQHKPETLEEVLDQLCEPLPLDERTDIDHATWGLSPEAQAAQQRLIEQFGD